MQILLLSGGSGKRLWPLSNNSRSKQFIKLLNSPDGQKESMVQRVIRQLGESDLKGHVTVATSLSQADVIYNQLGEYIDVVVEPERRDTFPAIALAASYLKYEKSCADEEVVVVMPCDPFTEAGYFKVIEQMVHAVDDNVAELVLMGITPTYPSAKYGYVVPDESKLKGGIFSVKRFTEKPNVATAEYLIKENAFWNGGVFAFKLGYMMNIVEQYIRAVSFSEIRNRYSEFPKISFDYEVAEKAKLVAVVPFSGKWKDLGTWNTLTDELEDHVIGNVITDGEAENTHIINELDLPIMCIGTKDLVIAASNDGILISEKSKSENIKKYADRLQCCPMYEERHWGEYKIIHNVQYSDGFQSLTKQLIIKAGKSLTYQAHHLRKEVWTVVDGEGLLAIEGKINPVKQGDTVCILQDMRHGLKAINDLTLIETQTGSDLLEDDVELFDWNWQK